MINWEQSQTTLDMDMCYYQKFNLQLKKVMIVLICTVADSNFFFFTIFNQFSTQIKESLKLL